MRILRIILIFFCFFILKGYNHAFARMHTHPFKGFPVQILENKSSLQFNNSQDHGIPADYSLDDEDDDSDFGSARKKIQVPFSSGPATVLFKNYILQKINSKQEFCKHSCHLPHDLYIFQRTIRV